MIKYLYGKKEFLEPITHGLVSPRFSDLSHYQRLENELMRDKEITKEFYWKKAEANLTVNGYSLANSSLASDPLVAIAPRHCFCLCLSARGNSPELYKRFGANYCLAIDVQVLMYSLKKTFGSQVGKLSFINSDITYYDKYEDLLKLNAEEAVFFKPEIFRPEAEHRVAIFYPLSEQGFQTADGKVFPFTLPGESTHLQSNSVNGSTYWQRIVVDHFEFMA